jgi:hypothetical protein
MVIPGTSDDQAVLYGNAERARDHDDGCVI